MWYAQDNQNHRSCFAGSSKGGNPNPNRDISKFGRSGLRLSAASRSQSYSAVSDQTLSQDSVIYDSDAPANDLKYRPVYSNSEPRLNTLFPQISLEELVFAPEPYHSPLPGNGTEFLTGGTGGSPRLRRRGRAQDECKTHGVKCEISGFNSLGRPLPLPNEKENAILTVVVGRKSALENNKKPEYCETEATKNVTQGNISGAADHTALIYSEPHEDEAHHYSSSCCTCLIQ